MPDHKWTVPVGGGFGRVLPDGDVLVNTRLEAYYNGLFGHAPGITNAGNSTARFTLQFILPGTKVPTLF